jgi:hypothetical protein
MILLLGPIYNKSLWLLFYKGRVSLGGVLTGLPPGPPNGRHGRATFAG